MILKQRYNSVSIYLSMLLEGFKFGKVYPMHNSLTKNTLRLYSRSMFISFDAVFDVFVCSGKCISRSCSD